MSKKFEIIDTDITRNRRLSSQKTYVVTTKVRVRKNVKLAIEDGTTILIQNGARKTPVLQRAALIFEAGSRLRAHRLYVKACDENYRQVKKADNGGLWFMGNHQNACKDNICTKVRRKTPMSSFKATVLSAYYLGRSDPQRIATHGDTEDDIDGLSILGVGPAEWAIADVRSFYSADDGIDLTNSHLKLNRLKVVNPAEDGINLSSSRLEVHRSLTLDVRKTQNTDRDLVDFETDEGASFLELPAKCRLDLDGVFGDEVVLSSAEMPKPVTTADNERNYKFKGVLKRAALIYSIDED